MPFKVLVTAEDEDGNKIDLYGSIPKEYHWCLDFNTRAELYGYFGVTCYEQNSCKYGMISAEYLLEKYPCEEDVPLEDEHWFNTGHEMFQEALEILSEKYGCVQVWWCVE